MTFRRKTQNFRNREINKYIDLGLLNPGDIFLSRSRSLISLLIRFSTFSSVSHAALVVSPLILFESTGEGVEYVIISPKIVMHKGNAKIAFQLPKEDNYFVFRVKKINEKISITTKKIIDATYTLAFYNYPDVSEFFKTLRFGIGFVYSKLPISKKKYLHLYDGCFCSWLVVDSYKKLGIQLFKKESNQITPAQLLRSRKTKRIQKSFEAKEIKIDDVTKNIINNIHEKMKIISNELFKSKIITKINKFQFRSSYFGDKFAERINSISEKEGWDFSVPLFNDTQMEQFLFQQENVRCALIRYSDSIENIFNELLADIKKYNTNI